MPRHVFFVRSSSLLPFRSSLLPFPVFLRSRTVRDEGKGGQGRGKKGKKRHRGLERERKRSLEAAQMTGGENSERRKRREGKEKNRRVMEGRTARTRRRRAGTTEEAPFCLTRMDQDLARVHRIFLFFSFFSCCSSFVCRVWGCRVSPEFFCCIDFHLENSIGKQGGNTTFIEGIVLCRRLVRSPSSLLFYFLYGVFYHTLFLTLSVLQPNLIDGVPRRSRRATPSAYAPSALQRTHNLMVHWLRGQAGEIAGRAPIAEPQTSRTRHME